MANESAKKEANYASTSQLESQAWTIHLSDLFYGSLETVAPGNKIYMDHLYLLKRETKRASSSSAKSGICTASSTAHDSINIKRHIERREAGRR